MRAPCRSAHRRLRFLRRPYDRASVDGPRFRVRGHVTFALSGEAEYDKLLWWLSPAVEYYGDMGAVSGLPGVQHQQHFIVPTLNFDFLDQLELNLGVGFGLTNASNGTFVKTIVGWTF